LVWVIDIKEEVNADKELDAALGRLCVHEALEV
jgi:hypothetical protein